MHEQADGNARRPSTDEILAAKITTALVQAGLVDPAKEQQLSESIARGALTSEDWRVYIESGMPRENDRARESLGDSNAYL